jgi:hypothetical protein
MMMLSIITFTDGIMGNTKARIEICRDYRKLSQLSAAGKNNSLWGMWRK